MKRFIIIAFALSLFLHSKPLFAENTTSQPVMISYDGKGCAMSWDIGVTKAFYERLNLSAVSEFYFVGTSSGSLMSSFFACRGLNQSSIDELLTAIAKLPKDMIDESPMTKILQLVLGIPPETSLKLINPAIDIVTMNDTCVPKIPLLIVAANIDVLDSRVKKPFNGKRDKLFDNRNYEVKDKATGSVLGKACTYFVNESMNEILKAVKPEERLCDIRLISTGKELRTAILASLAEPTYYAAVTETDPSKIQSVYPVKGTRVYNGGFVINSPIQDVKRARPETYTVGTGRPVYSRLHNRIIKNWFTMSMNETLKNQLWWFDSQVPISNQHWNKMYEKKTTTLDQVALGYATAKDCFENGPCIPDYSATPHFANSSRGENLEAKRHRGLKAIFK